MNAVQRNIEHTERLAMAPDEVMEHLGSAYLAFLEPTASDPEAIQSLQRLRGVASSIGDATVSRLINGLSWRERLVGLYLAAMRGADRFANSIMQSLRDPRGLAIVPACAALSLALRGERPLDWEPRIGELDGSAFSDELGWGLAKLRWALKWASTDLGSLSPNDAKNFEDYVQLYVKARVS